MRAERNEGAGPKKMGVAEYLTCLNILPRKPGGVQVLIFFKTCLESTE